MAETTGISYADSTANLWLGCQKVSEACDNCYAEDLMATTGSRFKRVEWGPGGERQFCKSGWADVKTWNARAAANRGKDPELGRRRRVFVNSLSDFFDNHPSVKWRGDAWNLIRRSPHVIFILVTKRPQLIARVLPPFWNEIAERVWVLTTAETQEWGDRRIPELFNAFEFHDRPAVLGVSCEPLLGQINLSMLQAREVGNNLDGIDALRGASYRTFSGDRQNKALTEKLDWVIVGGESGKQARPMSPFWAEGLRDQCAAAGVPFHFKQWGAWRDASVLGDGSRLWTLMSSEANDPAKETVAWPDGTFSFGAESDHGGRGVRMIRTGKAAAGHLLQGRAIQEVPNVK